MVFYRLEQNNYFLDIVTGKMEDCLMGGIIFYSGIHQKSFKVINLQLSYSASQNVFWRTVFLDLLKKG